VQCTGFRNEGTYAGGLYVGSVGLRRVLIDRSIIAGSLSGPAVYVSSGGSVTLACCDLWGNAGGDWIGVIAPQLGVNGNICEDPIFCFPDSEELSIEDDSPCAPFTPPNPQCDLIGAWPVGCLVAAAPDREDPVPPQDPGPKTAALSWRLTAVPNPFTQEVRLTLRGTRPGGFVSVRIFQPGGRLVRELWNGWNSPESFSWDGSDEAGRPLRSGAYFVVIRDGVRRTGLPVLLLQ